MRRIFNGGEWTQARYTSFIKSALRSASIRWPPRYSIVNDGCVGRFTNISTGKLAKHYKCEKCCRDYPLKQIEVNHRTPVIPLDGFDSWDQTIERMFCEKEGLELLCKECHKAVTKSENEERKRHKDERKQTEGLR